MRQQGADVLRVARLGERREADEVGEEDGDDAPFDVRPCRRGLGCDERCPALAAEALARLVRHAAARAGIASDAPQFPQNFCPSRFSVPQLVHWATSGA